VLKRQLKLKWVGPHYVIKLGCDYSDNGLKVTVNVMMKDGSYYVLPDVKCQFETHQMKFGYQEVFIKDKSPEEHHLLMYEAELTDTFVDDAKLNFYESK
jgi:hypothetical protein